MKQELEKLLAEEIALRDKNKRGGRKLTQVYHAENVRGLERVLRLLRDRAQDQQERIKT